MTVTIRDAATVMLVRDGNDGLEVFMVRRHLQSDFVGGAYVFPGGAVDPADRADPELDAVCVGRSDAQASAELGIDDDGLAYWVAAIRESFEEAGVLLALDGDDFVSLADDAVAERFAEHRRRVDAGEERLVEVCEQEGLVLAVGELHYFSHWITPKGPTRRYDTRFFVCRAPDEQVPLHDDAETIASVWIRPAEALERHSRGELELILPTIRNLEAIGRFDTSAELLDATRVRSGTEVPTMLPVIVEVPEEDARLGGAGVRILLPGDEGYEAAMENQPDDGAIRI